MLLLSLGKGIIFLGLYFIILGGLLIIGDKINFFGKLPGDIAIKKENFSFYFPLTTSLLLSIILSLIFNLFFKILRK